MPAVKITNKPIGIPGDDTHFIVTQPELPEGYTPTGQETEEELAELKVESVREIEMDAMVALIQEKLDMDETPTEDSAKPITSGGVKAALDEMDEDISSLNEDITNLDTRINGTEAGTQDVTEDVSWTSGGGVIYFNGEINHSLTNYSHADIPLNGATHVSGYTRAGQATDQGMCFLDANGTWISGDYHEGATSYDWNYDFDVPNGATTLRICCATFKLGDFTCVLTMGTSSGLAAEVEQLRSDLDDLSVERLSDTAVSNPSSGQVLSYDGITGKWKNSGSTITVDSSLSISSINPVENKAVAKVINDLDELISNLDIQVNGGDILVPTPVTLQDSNKKNWFIGRIGGSWTAGTNRGYYVEVPTNCAKISCVGNSSYPSEIALLSNIDFVEGQHAPIVGSNVPTVLSLAQEAELEVTSTVTYFYCRRMDPDGHDLTVTNIIFYLSEPSQDSLAGKIDNMSISALKDVSINNLSDGQHLEYNALLSKWVNTYTFSGMMTASLDFRWMDGCYVDGYAFTQPTNRGNFVASETFSVAVADVSDIAGGVIHGHTRFSDRSGLAFYDSNGIYINGYMKGSSDPFDYDYEFNVPETAKTVIISCKSDHKSVFTINGSGNIKTVIKGGKISSTEYRVPDWVFGSNSEKSDFPYNSQTRVEDIYNYFDTLVSMFPRNVTKVNLGNTSTPTGDWASIDPNVYPMNAYVIQGDRYIQGNDFIILSNIHGSEWYCATNVAYFVKNMLFNPDANEFLSFIKWNCRILIVPLMNPWGYQNVQRGNGRGVDMNRNYNLNWDGTTEYSPLTGGTEPFSENETSLVNTYISQNFSNAKFLVELHSRGRSVLTTDDRWWTKVNSNRTEMQELTSKVNLYMRRLFGGVDSTNVTQEQTPTCRAYYDFVCDIPGILMESEEAFNKDASTFETDEVAVQNAKWFGAMIQTLVQTYLM